MYQDPKTGFYHQDFGWESVPCAMANAMIWARMTKEEKEKLIPSWCPEKESKRAEPK